MRCFAKYISLTLLIAMSMSWSLYGDEPQRKSTEERASEAAENIPQDEHSEHKSCSILKILSDSLPKSNDQPQRRKRVGVVLSGGGAKGAAHIGALRVIEQAGIPIDYIAGTSMGAIVGAMYAIGYDINTLDSIVRNQNWINLLADRVERRNLSFGEKEIREKYLITVPMAPENKIVGTGFVGGHNVYNMLTELTTGFHDSISFLDLPIPFACVAYDMVSGETIVMDRGILPRAIRASMSIPGAFKPVRVGDMLLIDGGISNNFPVNVVRDMGAEIVIGIDVGAGRREVDEINTLPDMFNQITYLTGVENYTKNREITDLYVHPDINSFHAGSFNSAAIDTLLLKGEQGMLDAWDKLLVLKEIIGVGEHGEPSMERITNVEKTIQIRHIYYEGLESQKQTTLERATGLKEYTIITNKQLSHAVAKLQGIGSLSQVSYRLEGPEPYNLIFTVQEASRNTISVGIRFDLEEMAALLLNATYSFKNTSKSHFDFTARLSESPYAQLAYVLGNEAEKKFTVSYKFKHNNMNLYSRGKKYSNFDFGHHTIDMNYSNIQVRNFKVAVGLEYEFYDYHSTLASREAEIHTESQGFIKYYIKANYESFDRRYNPTRGQWMYMDYTLSTSNFATYKGGTPYSAITFDYLIALSVSKRVAFLPGIFARVLIGKNFAFSGQNFIGGTYPGRYMPQQLPFVGVSRIELVENAILGAKLDFRLRLWVHNFVSIRTNYAKTHRTFYDLLDGKDLFGVGVAYSYNSIIGPIEAQIDWSNRDKKIGFYCNIGFYF